MIFKAWRKETIPVVGIFTALVGLVSEHVSVLAMGIFLLGLAYLSSYLARQTLTTLVVKSQLVQPHAEIGEAILAELVVQNPMPWPILDVQWKIDLPDNVDTNGPGTALMAPGGNRQTLTGTLVVGARQRVRIQYHLKGQARGRWNIGPGSLTFHDPLSWNELVREDQQISKLSVWPRRLALPQGFWSANPQEGEVRGHPWDPVDPTRIAGIRPYQPGDPVRHIAAHASARMARLMVRQLDPVAERSIEVLIHPKTTEAHWHGIDRPLLEDTISLAASVAEASVASHFVTGLSGSGAIPGHIRGFTLASAKHPDPGDFLTALAWLQPSGTMDDDLGHVLVRLTSRLSANTRLVYVSPYWSDDLSRYLEPRVRRGLQLTVLTLGAVGPPIPPWVRTVWRFHEGAWTHA